MSDDRAVVSEDPFPGSPPPDQISSTPARVGYINRSGVPDDVIMADRQFHSDVASVIEQWTQTLSPGWQEPTFDLFHRHRWGAVIHQFAEMAKAAWAVEHDDILSTLADVIEGLSFSGCSMETFDDDEEDIWNQWAGEVDLDSRLREMSRELFKVSQVYIGLDWQQRVYTVRDAPVQEAIDEVVKLSADGTDPQAPPAPQGRGRGNFKRKKKFPLVVPVAMTIFDPTKIMPVGQLLFGRERFAYVATRAEQSAFGAALDGSLVDPLVLALVERKYIPTPVDIAACAKVGVDPQALWLMREDAVFRHTLTRAHYERFAPVRLKSIFPILEMKEHLRAADRSSLIGTTNFLIVITKGSDKLPAKQSELENLHDQARTVARLPVLIGDHRLHVDIVAPPADNTLIESRWMVLDSRLVFRALQSFQPIVQTGGAQGGGKGMTEMLTVVSRGLESRRHMLVRTLEAKVFRAVLARNAGVLDQMPSLVFVPKRISLDFNADIMTAVLKLRDRGDISRETALEELDFDQGIEVRRRARERATFDKVFNSSTPYSSPVLQPYNPAAADGTPSNGTPVGPPKPVSPEGGRPRGVPEEGPRQSKDGPPA